MHGARRHSKSANSPAFKCFMESSVKASATPIPTNPLMSRAARSEFWIAGMGPSIM